MSTIVERRYVDPATGLVVDIEFRETEPGQAKAFLERMAGSDAWASLRPAAPLTAGEAAAPFVFVFGLLALLLTMVLMIAVVAANKFDPQGAPMSNLVAIASWVVALLVFLPVMSIAEKHMSTTRPS